jgi:bacterioferritin-associated ferredoxin
MLLNAIDNHSHLQFNVVRLEKDCFSMYVCICNGITDKQIRRAAEAGVRDIRQLQDTLGVASGCGSCKQQATEILGEYRAASRQFTPVIYTPALA